MNEDENRNEIAATLFSVLAGLAVLLLAGWLMTTRGCSDRAKVTQETVKKAPAILPLVSKPDVNIEELELKNKANLVASDTEIKRLKRELKEARESKVSEPAYREPKAKAGVEVDDSELKKLRLDNSKYEKTIEGLNLSHTEKINALTKEKQNIIDDLRLKIKGFDDERKDFKAQLAGGAVAAAGVASLAKVKADLKDKTTMVGNLEGKVSGLEKELAAAKKAISAGDNEKITQLMTQNKKLEGEVGKLKANAGKLTEIDGKLQKLAADNAALLKENEGLKAGSGDVKKLRKDNGDLKKQIATLTAGAAGLATLTKKNKDLSDELAKLRGASDRMKASDSKVKLLTTENTELKGKVEELNGEIITLKNADKLKAAVTVPGLNLPLLVNDPNNLDNGLKPLFAELRGVSDADVASKKKVYDEIKARGKATPVNNVWFGSGSSWVSDEKKAELKTLIANNPDSQFLVVGYASVDGQPQANAQLSSKRASEVAQQIVQGNDNAKNRVQAVYFGQTKRFDLYDPNPNRVVEVWRVDK